MSTWRMKLVGLAHVYRFVEVTAADLDAAVDDAEKTYNQSDQVDGWIVDQVLTQGPNAVRVVTGSWRKA